MSRREDAATATVGGGLTAGSGYVRHKAVQQYMKGNDEPRFHGPAILRRGSKGTKRTYLAGAALGLVGAPALAIGTTRFVRNDSKDKIIKSEEKEKKPGFIRTGFKGTGKALFERAETATDREVPNKARAAGLATSLAAGAGGVYGSRALMRGSNARTKALVSPVAGTLTAAAATPLSSRVIDRVSPGYVATPSGVKRKKKALKRPSSSSYSNPAVPRSFTADIAKAMPVSDREYRARVAAAGVLPIPIVQHLQTGRAAAKYGDPRYKKQNARTSFTAGVTSEAAGAVGGAYGAAALANRNGGDNRFNRVAGKASDKIDNAKAKVNEQARKVPGVASAQDAVENAKSKLKPAGASNSRTGQMIRRMTKPLKSQPKAVAIGALVGQAVTGAAGTQLGASMNIRRSKRGQVSKIEAAPGMTRREAEKQIRRKRRNAAISDMAALTGLAGAGTFAASLHPKFKASQKTLQTTSLGLGLSGGAVGSLNTLSANRTQRRDLRAQKKALEVSKGMPDQAVLHVPRGLRKTKTYSSSGMRRLNNGTLVRTKAGVR